MTDTLDLIEDDVGQRSSKAPFSDCSGTEPQIPLSRNRADALSRDLLVLARPERIQILTYMLTCDAEFTSADELQRVFELADLDSHLAAMHAAGLVEIHRLAAKDYYRARPQCWRDLDVVTAGHIGSHLHTAAEGTDRVDPYAVHPSAAGPDHSVGDLP